MPCESILSSGENQIFGSHASFVGTYIHSRVTEKMNVSLWHKDGAKSQEVITLITQEQIKCVEQ